jgi:transglutaminase-like putative cysteine protease
MKIQCGHEIVFELPTSVSMQLMLYIHPSRSGNLRQPDQLQISPPVPIKTHLDSYGNRCAILSASAGQMRIFSDNVVTDSGALDVVEPWAAQHPIRELPSDVLCFLLGSRYCEVDRLSDSAFQLFSHEPLGWPRVQAICNWVHQNIYFGYQFARPTKTAHDVFIERTGVCRDFMHLAITFCRCLGIPARYATGYLGDIGVPALPSPMDFSAWFEVYLGGRWYTFDARFNTPRIGRILVARGRDAVDVALTTSFGHATLKSFKVWSHTVE